MRRYYSICSYCLCLGCEGVYVCTWSTMKGEVPQKLEEASRAARISCCHRFNCTFLQRSHSFSLCLQVPTIFFNVFFHQIKWANQYNTNAQVEFQIFEKQNVFLLCFLVLPKNSRWHFCFFSFCRRTSKKTYRQKFPYWSKDSFRRIVGRHNHNLQTSSSSRGKLITHNLVCVFSALEYEKQKSNA